MMLRRVHLNVRSVFFMLFAIIMNRTMSSQSGVNQMEVTTKMENQKNSTTLQDYQNVQLPTHGSLITNCSANVECNKLELQCLQCKYSTACTYGKKTNISCEVKKNYSCLGERKFPRMMICQYCYQTKVSDHECVQKGNCNSIKQTYRTNCTVKPNVMCLGSRNFFKNVQCNWTDGYKWSNALIISITLGGFGADRFYLGHWQEGIGKLFSFGGLGVWTLIDVILISLHYLGPANGSLYI